MIGHYILDGHTPVLVTDCDIHTPEGLRRFLEWARWFENGDNRRVAFTRVLGICYVSTIFLAMDHGFMPGGNAPVLFETMAFWQGEGGEECRRACTWAGAEKTHQYMVEYVASPRAVFSYVGRRLCAVVGEAREDWVRRWRELRGLGPRRSADPLWAMAEESMERLRAIQAERDDLSWIDYA